ncbi:MAG: hypothetical protein HC932_03475 [Thermales bacterium]|nr:hypothetical protein [Thermales bacterium]
MEKSTKATILLLLHQPFRVTDPRFYPIKSISELFEGRYNKNGIESSNEIIFKRVAKNSYIPTAKFFLELLQNKPNLRLNFSFSGLLLEQCQLFPDVGSQIIEIFKKLISTGQVGIAGDNYYHSLVHMVSLKDLAQQIDKQRELIKN